MKNHTDDKRTFKIKLSDVAAQSLSVVVIEKQSERRDYQIGVGTIAAELLEAVTSRPDLITQLLGQSPNQPKRVRASG